MEAEKKNQTPSSVTESISYYLFIIIYLWKKWQDTYT